MFCFDLKKKFLLCEGPGGKSGDTAAGCGEDSEWSGPCCRHPVGRKDESVCRPAGLPRQPANRHLLPAHQHRSGKHNQNFSIIIKDIPILL